MCHVQCKEERLNYHRSHETTAGNACSLIGKPCQIRVLSLDVLSLVLRVVALRYNSLVIYIFNFRQSCQFYVLLLLRHNLLIICFIFSLSTVLPTWENTNSRYTVFMNNRREPSRGGEVGKGREGSGRRTSQVTLSQTSNLTLIAG